MNFLNPLFLIGLLAAALPIVIHLINRRRAVRRKFPAIEFLLRSQKRLARRLKVRQLVLLALRVAALLLIPLAMARPYLISDSGTTEADRMPTAIVFVVDDSASMGYNGRAVWDRAVSAVDDIISELRPWDRVALVYASDWPSGAPLGEDTPIPELTDAHNDVSTALSKAIPSERGTDLARALRTGAEILAASDQPRRKLILVSDLQKSGLDPTDLPVDGLGIPVEVVDVRDAPAQANLAIVGANYEQQSAGARPEFSISATVANHSDQDASGVEVHLVIDGEDVASGLVDVPAGKTAAQLFNHTFDRKGLHRAELRLARGADALEADNVYFLPIHLAQRVRVLMVNGDPRSVHYQDELYYMERALYPGKGSTSSIIPEITGIDGLASYTFADYDVVLLANVEKLPRASVRELVDFVKAGGGLLFIAGDNVNPEVYNNLFGELLPKPIRSIKLLARQDDPDAPLKITRMGQMDTTHPVFKVFDLPGGETIQAVSVYSYLLLEPTPSGESRILLSYTDGAPALLERELGEGRSALLTTTVDRDWSDLPIKTAFLPLRRRLVRYLARRSTSAEASERVVAAKVALDAAALGRGRIEVRDPEGGRIVPAPESTAPDAPLTFIPRTTGHYRVMRVPDAPDAEPSEIVEMAFAVNVAAPEANLAPYPADELSALLSGGDPDNPSAGNATVAIDTPEKRIGVWSSLLFLVTLILLAETILGTRRSVLIKLWNRVRGRSNPELDV
ncbi:MAG: hypothetical protein CMH57_05405 [Myxococcales bacterium]|nr:hypothetical protein [Myxococcales bacterium]